MRKLSSAFAILTFIGSLGALAGTASAAKDLPVNDKEFAAICNRTDGCLPVGDMGEGVNGYLYDDTIILCDDGGCTAYPPSRTGTGKSRNSAIAGLLKGQDTLSPAVPMSPQQALKLKNLGKANVLAN